VSERKRERKRERGECCVTSNSVDTIVHEFGLAKGEEDIFAKK
jgi:hypothetical protein